MDPPRRPPPGVPVPDLKEDRDDVEEDAGLRDVRDPIVLLVLLILAEVDDDGELFMLFEEGSFSCDGGVAVPSADNVLPGVPGLSGFDTAALAASSCCFFFRDKICNCVEK